LNEPDGEMDEGRDEAAAPEAELFCRSMGGAYGTAGDKPFAPRNDPAPPPSTEPPPPFAPKAAAISGVDGVKPPPLPIPLPPLLDRPGARERGLPDAEDEDEDEEDEEEEEEDEECREPVTGGANFCALAIGCAFALPRIEMADVSRALTTDCCGGKTLSFIGDTDVDADADAALPEAARTRGLLVPAGTTCVAIGVPSVANVHCTSMPPVGALSWWPAAPSALGSLLIEKSACGTGDAPRSAWC
jgi:hypothetical protein